MSRRQGVARVHDGESSIAFWPREHGSDFADRLKKIHGPTCRSFYRRAQRPPEINFPGSLESHPAIADLRNGASISASRELLGRVSPPFDFEPSVSPESQTRPHPTHLTRIRLFLRQHIHRRHPSSCCLYLPTVRLLCLGHLLRLPSHPRCQRTEEDLNGSIPPIYLHNLGQGGTSYSHSMHSDVTQWSRCEFPSRQ